MNIRHYLKQLCSGLPPVGTIDQLLFIIVRLITHPSRWLSSDLRMSMNLVFAKNRGHALLLTILGRDAVIS